MTNLIIMEIGKKMECRSPTAIHTNVTTRNPFAAEANALVCLVFPGAALLFVVTFCGAGAGAVCRSGAALLSSAVPTRVARMAGTGD